MRFKEAAGLTIERAVAGADGFADMRRALGCNSAARWQRLSLNWFFLFLAGVAFAVYGIGGIEGVCNRLRFINRHPHHLLCHAIRFLLINIIRLADFKLACTVQGAKRLAHSLLLCTPCTSFPALCSLLLAL